jgi:hypothetical protein
MQIPWHLLGFLRQALRVEVVVVLLPQTREMAAREAFLLLLVAVEAHVGLQQAHLAQVVLGLLG